MKRKVGLLLGYNGKGYHGLQFNGDLKTIEKEVIAILLKNNCITELNSQDPRKIGLKSSSRTDKGVHASFNLLSVKISQEPTPELFQILQSDFSEKNMHLYKMVKLPKKFLDHKCARSRIYKYFIPTYFLQESNFEEEWKRQELIDNGKESEKQEKIRRIYGEEEIKEEIRKIKGYTSNSIAILKNMLNLYVGTKNYHNFTLKRVEGNMKRFIKQITISDPIIRHGVEYVEVKIHGQSFLLHQIRKMISFAVLNCRYARGSYEANFSRIFSDEDIHVPKCPSPYLFLSDIFFDDFNMRRSEQGIDAIEVDKKEKERFEEEKIHPSIFELENLHEWRYYLDSVRFHHENFDVFIKNHD